MARVILVPVVVALAIVAGGCKKTANEEAAVRACVEHGNTSEECARANRGLASGESNIAGALEQEQKSLETGRRVAAELEQKGKAAVQEGKEPCAALFDKVMQEFPGACEDGAKNVVEDARAGVGCVGALGDWDATKETVPDFLADCPPR